MSKPYSKWTPEDFERARQISQERASVSVSVLTCLPCNSMNKGMCARGREGERERGRKAGRERDLTLS